MIELARHIEFLLLKNNCVIVPHLGGFVTHYVPARYSDAENQFLPPHRNIGFNPQLNINDGLLVQSYMQAHDTNYPETLRIIEEAVAQLKDELQQNGEFRLDGIGTLTMNMDGNYGFVPNEAGVLSPELYGLDAFMIERQQGETIRREAKQADEAENSAKEKRNYTFRINRELVNYAAAAVIAIVFYFAWATPTTHSDMLSPIPAEASLKPVSPSVLPATSPQSPAIAATASPATAAPKAETPSEAEPAEKSKEETVQQGFCIVLLSCVPQKNAERFVEQLHSENLPLASVNIKKKMVRVLYGNYASEAEAYGELNRLRKTNKYFSDAWVMETK